MSLCLAFLGVVLVGGGLTIGGGYFGPSGHVRGTVVAVSGGRPTVAYEVDGRSYQTVTTEHGPWFTIGQSVDLCYNPDNPNHAQTCSSRPVMVAFGLVAAPFLIAAVWVLVHGLLRRRRQRAVISIGRVVEAPIRSARANSLVHVGSTILRGYVCAWQDPVTGRDYRFKSQYLWSSPGPITAAWNQIPVLPVYIDPDRPDKGYYVDDRAIGQAVKAAKAAGLR